MDICYFENIPIRCLCDGKEWLFFIEDFIHALTDSPSPKSYWGMLKKNIIYCNKEGIVMPDWSLLNIIEVKVKRKSMDYTNKEGLFILFINSPNNKIELMNKWLNSLDLSVEWGKNLTKK